MSKLVLHEENDGTREFPLDRERITLGRKAQNDIHLDGSAVSGIHAVIITLGSDSFLEDLNSTNGTRVNQKSVHKCVLHDGDEIKIAGYKFTFISEAVAQNSPGRTLSATPNPQPAPQTNQTALDAVTLMPELTELRTSTAMGMSTVGGPGISHAEPAQEGAVLGVIRILAGAGSGQILELVRPVTTLGKPGLQVAAITRREGRYYLGLVEGEALPLVNGAQLSALPYLLQHRDVIGIAGIQLEFTLKQERP